MGRERALAANPLTDPAAVRSAIELTAEGRRALAISAPPLDGIPDVRDVLEQSRTEGGFIDGTDLLRVLAVLDAAPGLMAFGRQVRSVAPGLAAISDTITMLPALRDALRQALADDGSVSDNASPRLRQLRREVRERRRRIVSDLERMLSGAEAERVLADRFVTVRHGRYVLPVRSEARGRVRGIVHDRSQSGQTIFVEPEGVVESNNALVEQIREEEQEVVRILTELTRMVGDSVDALTAIIQTVADLDWIFARAELAERMDATAPIVSDDRAVALRGARHPLLLAQSWRDPSRPVVPVDIEITPDRPLLVITGPNAGGKTVVLKTLALLALMAQVGGHVPAAEGSRLPVFTAIHALVGDDQSVAENLSTFSAFVRQVRDILDSVDAHALVLLDELGAGTDPDEGAALAQAILETLEARGCLVLATTHLEPLKAFATTHPGARNASVEFDAETLAPTFRLRYDRPGGSYALTIAARLGLAPELILRAEAHRSAQSRRLGELIARLDEVTRDEAEKSRELARRDSETAARLATARDVEARAQREAKDLLERARRDAAALLTDVRRTVNEEKDRLRKAERSRATLDESRRRLADAHARVQPAAVAPMSPAPVEDLVPGAAVAADHLGVRGEVVAVAGSTATIRSGTVTVRVPVSALRLADGTSTPVSRDDRTRAGQRRSGAADAIDREARSTRVTPEIHLLGQRADEARDAVERYLDQAFLAGLSTVRVVHGKGTGVLRRVVREMLATHPHVESYRDGEPGEGGSGATVAALKVG